MNVFSIEKGDQKFGIGAKLIWLTAAYYRFDFYRSGHNRSLIKIGNVYSIFPISIWIFFHYILNIEYFTYSVLIGIIFFYASIFFDVFRGEFRWNTSEIFLAPHFADMVQYVFVKRRTIAWDEITEINITKPLQRISIYAGNRHIELDILEPFVSDEARRKAEFSLLAFARYARLKLRNKPGVVWST